MINYHKYDIQIFLTFQNDIFSEIDAFDIIWMALALLCPECNTIFCR